MSKHAKTAITPTREEDFPAWYQQVVKQAQLAENAVTRGCMVIKPSGYAVWEAIQQTLDEMIKDTGHVNAYFPLLIPLSFLQKEAEHVDGFAKECAVVTHHRLEAGEDGSLVPAGKLTEPYIIRPTSETVIGESYARWVQSYRDLPLLINQWANVMRWEMRTRLFLRTAEFLWQEGHTVHATAEEAVEETLKMLGVYETFAREHLAIPVISGEKTPDERFPGAENTYTIEAMMQDGKAVQAGTSHFLGQNFAKASNIVFQDQDSKEQTAWTTSWGVSTRLIGALIMTHSDDNGFVLPPKIAQYPIVIQPIYKNDEQRGQVLEYCHHLKSSLESIRYHDKKIRVHLDDRDIRGGEKTWQNVKKGYPLIVEVGPRDVKNGKVFVARRDQFPEGKSAIDMETFTSTFTNLLDDIQSTLLARAEKSQLERIKNVESLDEFKAFFTNPDNEHLAAGFAYAGWCEDAIDHPVLKELKVTPRCIPLKKSGILETKHSNCIFTGKPATASVLFAKAY